MLSCLVIAICIKISSAQTLTPSWEPPCKSIYFEYDRRGSARVGLEAIGSCYYTDEDKQFRPPGASIFTCDIGGNAYISIYDDIVCEGNLLVKELVEDYFYSDYSDIINVTDIQTFCDTDLEFCELMVFEYFTVLQEQGYSLDCDNLDDSIGDTGIDIEKGGIVINVCTADNLIYTCNDDGTVTQDSYSTSGCSGAPYDTFVATDTCESSEYAYRISCGAASDTATTITIETTKTSETETTEASDFEVPCKSIYFEYDRYGLTYKPLEAVGSCYYIDRADQLRPQGASIFTCDSDGNAYISIYDDIDCEGNLLLEELVEDYFYSDYSDAINVTDIQTFCDLEFCELLIFENFLALGQNSLDCDNLDNSIGDPEVEIVKGAIILNDCDGDYRYVCNDNGAVTYEVFPLESGCSGAPTETYAINDTCFPEFAERVSCGTASDPTTAIDTTEIPLIESTKVTIIETTETLPIETTETPATITTVNPGIETTEIPSDLDAPCKSIYFEFTRYGSARDTLEPIGSCHYTDETDKFFPKGASLLTCDGDGNAYISFYDDINCEGNLLSKQLVNDYFYSNYSNVTTVTNIQTFCGSDLELCPIMIYEFFEVENESGYSLNCDDLDNSIGDTGIEYEKGGFILDYCDGGSVRYQCNDDEKVIEERFDFGSGCLGTPTDTFVANDTCVASSYALRIACGIASGTQNTQEPEIGTTDTTEAGTTLAEPNAGSILYLGIVSCMTIFCVFWL